MRNLFGHGLHPNAGPSPDAGSGALGRRFLVFVGAPEMAQRVAIGFGEFNQANGLGWRTPVPLEVRARIRGEVATEAYVERFGRPPAGERDLTAFLARESRQRTTAVAGYDLTFSPVKSVSALWALADEQVAREVQAAHDAAVDSALRWLQRRAAYTRLGRGGVRQVPTRGLLATRFTHRDSRAGDGLIARNPFAAVRRPRVSSVEAQFLEPAQVRLLLEAARDSRYGLFFEFLVHTGLRRGEALALTWSDVDLDERLVRVRGTLARLNGELRVSEPKSTKSRRTIPLSEPALDVLRRVAERTGFERVQAVQLWVESGHVFVTDVGKPCDPRNALRALTTAARQAALPHVGLHTLRHSAASVMLSEGVPISVVSQILGHSGISITADVYGHIAPDVSRSALDILGAALTPAHRDLARRRRTRANTQRTRTRTHPRTASVRPALSIAPKAAGLRSPPPG